MTQMSDDVRSVCNS